MTMSKMPPAFTMPNVDLKAVSEELARTGKRVHVLWQEDETLAFVARGREYRSEFHINPADEVMYMLRGEMRLHYRTSEGTEDVAVLTEGSIIYTPGGIPHSPRFPPDAYALIIERKRAAGEIDAFRWYCPPCDALLHEERFVVSDYALDPVSTAYAAFFDSAEHRTCRACGHVTPDPR
jgi:3-hydroxyanthranilate 3,4-dioxygenase